MADILLNSIEGGGGGGLIMPIRVATAVTVSLKETTASSVNSNGSAFYTAIETFDNNSGKKAGGTTAILSSGTQEKTVIDTVGSGVLTNVITPKVNIGGGTITIRVTIDGKETAFSATLPGVNDKIVIGDVYDGGVSTSAIAITLCGQYDRGFSNSTLNELGIMTPEQVIQRGISGMVFKNSLKITMQNSSGFASGGSSDKACVLYTTYIPEGL